MTALLVSDDTLEGLSTTLTAATRTFRVERPVRPGDAFGADEVDRAFSVFWSTEERATDWLADTSRTLAQYAEDTIALFEEADGDLARRSVDGLASLTVSGLAPVGGGAR